MSVRFPPLKYPGGKWYEAAQIHANAPPVDPKNGQHRVILYAGGLGEFWRWPYDNVSEVVNDKDHRVINFWRVLKDKELFADFERIALCIPFGREPWTEAAKYDFALDRGAPVCKEEMVAQAVEFFVLVRQSLAGRAEDFAALTKGRVRRRMNEQASAWLTTIDGLPEVHQRLLRVVLECMPALKLLLREDSPTTFFYADPPYLLPGKEDNDYYEYAMTRDDHAKLCRALCGVRGRVMLSGYRNDVYDGLLSPPRWRRVDFLTTEKASHGDTKGDRVESLWLNYAPDGRRLR